MEKRVSYEKSKKKLPNYIFQRLKTSEAELKFVIRQTLREKAEAADFKKCEATVLKPLNIKSMPKFYKRMMRYMFNFMWEEKIRSQLMFTWEWKGQLWANLDKVPKEARELIVTNKLEMSRPVFKKDMIEGMDVDYTKDWRSYDA